MLDKQEIDIAIQTISKDILITIILPLINITESEIVVDLYQATIDDYTMDEILNSKIVKEIEKKYKLKLKDNIVDAYVPLALLSLYILIHGQTIYSK